MSSSDMLFASLTFDIVRNFQNTLLRLYRVDDGEDNLCGANKNLCPE
jgi:hypothetical protein